MEQCWAQEATDRPSFADVSQRLATAVRTFATSRYKVEYEQLQARTAPLQPHELLTSVYDLINDYAQRHGLPAAQALTFFQTLQANALEASAYGHVGSNATPAPTEAEAARRVMAELLTQPQLIALRMYSSAATLNGREFCSILNEALREDRLTHTVAVARALSSYLHTRMSRGGGASVAPVRWPAANRVFRGCALPPQHHWFFSVGRQYRIPMFLSTSGNRGVAEGMMRDRGGPDYVLWIIDFDDSRQCDHVNYVNKNDGSLSTPTPNTAAEDEYLFAPYGTFTVTGAAFQPTGTVSEANPHVVTLRAAVNNRSEREDVQSAPWA